MDKNEEFNNLRKELFRLRFEIELHKKDPEYKIELKKQAEIIRKKMAALMREIAQDDGQIGFAFTDTIDEEKIEEGRKLK